MRCCGRTVNGNFCTQCGKAKSHDPILELYYYIKSNRDWKYSQWQSYAGGVGHGSSKGTVQRWQSRLNTMTLLMKKAGLEVPDDTPPTDLDD